MKLHRFNLLFRPLDTFPTIDPDTDAIVVQIEVQSLPDGDVAGTIVANLGATSAEDAIALKGLLGQVLHRISHDLLNGTVFDAQVTSTGGAV